MDVYNGLMVDRPSRLFGPVPSRRLGLSLGIDLVPFKTCTYDCVYCQLGCTTRKTSQRGSDVPIEGLVQEIQDRISKGPRPDSLTISGSGEPTLHPGLGDVISCLKSSFSIPVTLITNGSLLWIPEVRRDCLLADRIMPTLAAGDEETFRRIHRPDPRIRFQQVIEGLQKLRETYRGLFWLEVFLVQGLNDSEEQILKIRALADPLEPDLIHVNTAIRPPADPGTRPLTGEELRRACELLGPRAVPVSDAKASAREVAGDPLGREGVAAMIERRPCTVQDIASGLGIAVQSAQDLVEELLALDQVEAVDREDRVFYSPKR